MSVNDWVETILYMLASIGALLIGFEMLSDNITRLAQKGLKKLFNKTSKSKLAGVGIGAGATMIMQSSGATTIMIVGFVNAGIMTLYQATAMIMGANIGTTITAQLASLSGGNGGFDFGAYALGLAGIGMAIVMFGKKERTKTIGYAFAGFGILFFGLECMSRSMKVPAVHDAISNVLQNISGPIAPFILFVFGIIITALVQSSSLTTSIIISLAAAGIYIGGGEGATSLNNNVLFFILGTNIGSCVTALISSLGANKNAKRASCIHLLFNTVGSVIFMIFLLVYKDFMADTFVKLFGSPQTQIAMFHTFFNVVCTIIFLPFVNWFVKISQFIIRDNKEEKENEVTFIDERMLKSPAIALHQVRKEMSRMFESAYNTLVLSINAFISKDDTKHKDVDGVNEELEMTSKKVIEYLVELANENIVFEDECTVSAFHRTIDDILRIGEIGDNVCKYTKRAVRDDINISESAINQLEEMKSRLETLYNYVSDMFMNKHVEKLDEANEVEESIDNLRKEMIDNHFDRLNRGECVPSSSGVFVNLVNNLERAADHITYIAAGVNEALSQSKK